MRMDKTVTMPNTDEDAEQGSTPARENFKWCNHFGK